MNKKRFIYISIISVLAIILTFLPLSTLSAETYDISAILECVEDNGDGTYTAYFGYENNEEQTIEIPLGPSNKLSGNVISGSPITTFTYPAPNHPDGREGRTPFKDCNNPDAAFSIVFDGNKLVWTLDGRTATASKDSKACPECAEPEPIPGGLVVFKYSGDQPLAGAVFDVVDGEGFAAKITSGADGYASITGLEPGTYYVREVIAPEGYDIDPNQYTVVVDEGGSGRVDIENDPLPAPTPTPTPPEVEVAGEIEVAGVSEELPYTGYNWIYYVIGFSIIALAGGLALALRKQGKRNEA